MPTTPPRRLARDPEDKVVAGVCAAAGRFTGTDPVLWRVVIAALALFGGAGLALYALAWVLVPRVDSPTSFVERHLRKADRSVDVLGVVLLVVVTVLLLALLDEGSGLVVLVVVAGLAYLAARERTAAAVPGPPEAAASASAPYAAGPPAPTPAAWAPQQAPASASWPATPAPWPATPPPFTGPTSGAPPFGPSLGPPGPLGRPGPPRPPRPRSVLGPLTLSTVALVTGVLLLLRQGGVDGITAPRVLAAAMLVLGVGLVVGTWYGRARWLLAVGLALGLVLLPTALVDDRLGDGAGERRWVPTGRTTAPDYRLGAGEAVLDLRELEPGSVSRITADIGFGSMVVLVPEDLSVLVRTRVGLGEAVLTPGDRTMSGSGETEDLGPPGGPALELDLHVGLGQIEVRRVEA